MAGVVARPSLPDFSQGLRERQICFSSARASGGEVDCPNGGPVGLFLRSKSSGRMRVGAAGWKVGERWKGIPAF
ncbi:hypothetical protein HMPREF0262_00912 [Clostridium sp. ATCC 29733]|nr:hypothetical protein HMPREF0262_00912 [Clostridium sp. ATCC 29733]